MKKLFMLLGYVISEYCNLENGFRVPGDNNKCLF